MAQTESTLQMGIGSSTGSTSFCQRCNSPLSITDGTDPEECEELGGFHEEYECDGCGNTGTLTYRYEDGKRSYTGVCAEYNE